MSGDDGFVVERVKEGEAVGFALADGFLIGLVVIPAVEYNFGAVAAGGRDLDQWGGQRHADAGADAAGGGVIGDGLGVVAGRGCDDAAGLLLFCQSEDPVEGSAFLERPGALQVLQFEVEFVAGERREGLGVDQRRESNGFADACEGLLDVDESDHWASTRVMVFRLARLAGAAEVQ
ncbi:MAG: hypothetical protein QM757_14255 [Paludibaculum sp.]